MTIPAPRTSPLVGLGITTPVLAAPMAGGPTTAALVTAGVASAYGVDSSDVAVYFLDRSDDEIAHAGRLTSDS